jgi:hypothetical protein
LIAESSMIIAAMAMDDWTAFSLVRRPAPVRW